MPSYLTKVSYAQELLRLFHIASSLIALDVTTPRHQPFKLSLVPRSSTPKPRLYQVPRYLIPSHLSLISTSPQTPHPTF